MRFAKAEKICRVDSVEEQDETESESEESLCGSLSLENCQASVCDLANTAQAQLIEQNRCKLKSILKCIVLCGEQNIALRGHRDDEKYENEKGNAGNFKALLHFRVDNVLKHHFETAARNATYSSKTIQNELISVIREYISIQIINEVKEGSFFTVLYS